MNNKNKEFINNLVFKTKNTTVLLGAGASCVCGLPSGAKLFEDLKKHKIKKFNGNDEEIKKIITTTDNLDIETYLSKIENAKMFYKNNNDSKKADNIEVFYNDCLKFIVNKIKINVPSRDVHKKFISKLLSTRNDLSKGRIKIFTTNYDTIIEDACAEEGIIAIDGFSFVGSKRLFNSNYFDYDVIDDNLTKRNNTPERINNLIYLHKLHGSVNWYKEENTFYCTNKNQEKKNPMIIIPGESKFKNSYDSPYLDMIGKFREGLCESELLIVIGYSFSDTHINNIIVESIQRNSNISVLICMRDEKCCELKCYAEFKDNLEGHSIMKFDDNILNKLKNIIIQFHNRMTF